MHTSNIAILLRVADDLLKSQIAKVNIYGISLFFHRACCYPTLFNTQLKHYALKYTLKHSHSLKH